MKTYKMYSEATKQIEDFTMREVLEKVAFAAKSSTKRNDSLDVRVDNLFNQIYVIETILGERFKVVNAYDEKPCRGASFSVIELSDRFRINYRCGYGMCNYAPCIEVMK